MYTDYTRIYTPFVWALEYIYLFIYSRYKVAGLVSSNRNTGSAKIWVWPLSVPKRNVTGDFIGLNELWTPVFFVRPRVNCAFREW